MDEIPDIWSIGNFSLGQSEGLIRLNTGLQNYIGSLDYPYRIGISAPTEAFENVNFYDFEDFIFDNFQAKNKSIVCAVLTSSSFMEIVMYTFEESVLENKLPLINKAFPTIKITTYCEKDPSWELYSDFLNSISNNNA